MNAKQPAAMITILIFMLTGIGYAQTEAGIMPDNVFYGLDVFFDDVSLALTFDAQAKAQKAIEIADERLGEVKTMAAKSDVASAEKAKFEYEKDLKIAGEAGERITKSSGESELEEKIAMEKNAEEHESTADSVIQEIKVKLEISSTDPQIKQKLLELVDSIENSAAEAKIKIVAEKEKVKVRISQETGKNSAEVETESRLIEERTGVSEIKKEKALDALEDASEEINEALQRFRKLYSFDAYETENIAVAIVSTEETSSIPTENSIPTEIKNVLDDAVKRIPVSQRNKDVEISPEIVQDVTESSPVAAGSGGSGSAGTTVSTRQSVQESLPQESPQPSMSQPTVTNEVKDVVKKNSDAKEVAVLIRQAMKHYAAAKQSFGEADYSSAYGQAIAAKKIAANANSKMGGSDDDIVSNEGTRINEIRFQTMLLGTVGPIEQGNFVINDAEKFNELWSRWFAEKQQTTVDFSKYTVIAVLAGTKPTGGYTIEIAKITNLEDKVVVSVIATAPGPDDIVTQATTSPYHIVEVEEKLTKEVEFEFLSAEETKPDISAFTNLRIKTDVDDGRTRVIIRKGDAKWDFFVESTDESVVIAKIAAATKLSIDEIKIAMYGYASGSGSSGSSGYGGTPRTTESTKYCSSNDDCACGVKIGTDECFYGNKRFVDTSQQCPDFCTGISGNLRITCVENECKQVSLEIQSNSGA